MLTTIPPNIETIQIKRIVTTCGNSKGKYPSKKRQANIWTRKISYDDFANSLITFSIHILFLRYSHTEYTIYTKPLAT